MLIVFDSSETVTVMTIRFNFDKVHILFSHSSYVNFTCTYLLLFQACIDSCLYLAYVLYVCPLSLSPAKRRPRSEIMPETATQRKRRLEKKRQSYKTKKNAEDVIGKSIRLSKHKMRKQDMSEEAKAATKQKDRERKAAAAGNATDDDRHSRRAKNGVQHARARSIGAEDPQHRDSRLAYQRNYASQARSMETDAQHEDRLRLLREAYNRRLDTAHDFIEAINQFADKSCEVCLKTCYSN